MKENVYTNMEVQQISRRVSNNRPVCIQRWKHGVPYVADFRAAAQKVIRVFNYLADNDDDDSTLMLSNVYLVRMCTVFAKPAAAAVVTDSKSGGSCCCCCFCSVGSLE